MLRKAVVKKENKSHFYVCRLKIDDVDDSTFALRRTTKKTRLQR
jgi:hypothetical protein